MIEECLAQVRAAEFMELRTQKEHSEAKMVEQEFADVHVQQCVAQESVSRVERSMAEHVQKVVHAPTFQYGHDDERWAQREAAMMIEEVSAQDRAARRPFISESVPSWPVPPVLNGEGHKGGKGHRGGMGGGGRRLARG